jgi:hypothetical protein
MMFCEHLSLRCCPFLASPDKHKVLRILDHGWGKFGYQQSQENTLFAHYCKKAILKRFFGFSNFTDAGLNSSGLYGQ